MRLISPNCVFDASLVQKLVQNDLLVPESLSDKFMESRITGEVLDSLGYLPGEASG